MCLCFKHWILNYYKEVILKLKSDSVCTLQLQVKGSGAKWTYSLIPHILHKDKTSILQRLVFKGLINGWMGVFHLGQIEAIRWNLNFTHFLSNISQIQFLCLSLSLNTAISFFLHWHQCTMPHFHFVRRCMKHCTATCFTQISAVNGSQHGGWEWKWGKACRPHWSRLQGAGQDVWGRLCVMDLKGKTENWGIS